MNERTDADLFNEALADYRERTGDTTELFDLSVSAFCDVLQDAKKLRRAQTCY